METRLLLLVLWWLPALAVAQDADRDGVSDALEGRLGMDPRHADVFELIHDDKSKADGDTSIGRGIERAGDFTKLWVCAAARNRYVWKIEFAKPWENLSGVAALLYVDADNNPDTGRRDKPFARGVDVMLGPGDVRLIEWPTSVLTASAFEGNALYLAADIDLHQQGGKSVYRCWLLTQNTAEGRESDADHMAPVVVRAAGRSDRSRPVVPTSHPLYHPPEVIENFAARMVPDAPQPTAEATWTTSWPCDASVQFAATGEGTEQSAAASGGRQNHRVFVPVQLGRTYRFRAKCASAEGEPRLSKIVSLKAAPPSAKGVVKRASLPLTLGNDQPYALSRSPLLIGLPFPRGALASVASIRVVQGGNESPVQTECAARWPDGTVKWAIVQFLADCAARSEAGLTLEYSGEAPPAAAAENPMIADQGDRLVCDTGRLRAAIDKRQFRLFRVLDRGAGGRGASAAGGLYVLDAAGKEYVSAQPDEVVIVENGPVRAVVQVRGRHTARDGSKLFQYIVRLEFYRGQSFVRVFHTFGNDNAGQTMTDIAQLGIRLPLVAPVQFEKRQMRLEDEPTGPAVITSGEVRLVADIHNLREQYPKAWRCADNALDIQLCPRLEGGEYGQADPVVSDRLYYYLRDGVYRFHSGVSKTHEIYLDFAGDGASDAAAAYRPWHHAAACRAPASWYADSGACGLMTPRVRGEFDEYESFVENNFVAFQRLRGRQAEYGMLNFGDWWGERSYNWGNIEYDTQHVMLMEYLRTFDRKFFERGCEAALHHRDVDGIHYAAAPLDVGKVHVHCMFHTGGYDVRTPDKGPAMPYGGFNRGHVWTRGLFDHYFLTGDRRSLEWALAIADHLAGPLTVGFSVGNHAERDTAWPIFGVMAAYEATADPFYLNAARIMVEDVIRRQNPETGNWGFPAGYSKVEPKPIGGYAWCCGLLISALDLYNRHAHDPRVNEVIVRAARWLVRDEWIKDRQGFRATSCPTFDAATPPGGACWSCANAMLIAHELTGERQFLDIARTGFSLFIAGSEAMGKGVTQSICLGPETLWRFKRVGITSLGPQARPAARRSVRRRAASTTIDRQACMRYLWMLRGGTR